MRNNLKEIKQNVLGEQKKKSCSKLMIAGFGITIVAAVAGAIWYFFFKDKDKSDDDWDDDDWDDDDDDDCDDCDDDDCDCNSSDVEDDDFVIEHDEDGGEEK